MNGNFLTGAGYFLRGLGMIFQPGLRQFVMVPLAANILLFSLMGWGLVPACVSIFMTPLC
jgi:CysZ protein